MRERTGTSKLSVALSERIFNGDRSAEEEFADLFKQRVYVMASARTGNPDVAQDLMQDIMISSLKALRNGQLKKLESLNAFVYGTARNVINNYLRNKKNNPKEVRFSSAHEPVSPSIKLESLGLLNLVRLSLNKLNSTDKKILLLNFVDGLKANEIANHLSLKPEVVRKRKSRALQKILNDVNRMSQK